MIVKNNEYYALRNDVWHNISLIRNTTCITVRYGDLVTVSEYTLDAVFKTLYIGGYDDDSPFHQFTGHIRGVVFDDLYPLFMSKNQRTDSFSKNVEFGYAPLRLINDTVTFNRSSVSLILDNWHRLDVFNISFDFKTPEKNVQLLSFTQEPYYFKLRKNSSRLIFESNLRGYSEARIVSILNRQLSNNWTSVVVLIDRNKTSLSVNNVKHINLFKGRWDLNKFVKPVMLGKGELFLLFLI